MKLTVQKLSKKRAPNTLQIGLKKLKNVSLILTGNFRSSSARVEG